jgi:hypothetical protein
MRIRFVPPHYQRDLLKELAHFEQGKKSVEEYYQELQTGMMHCGIEKDNEALLARFFRGLNKEIQTILDYKEYNTITHLFHLACKAECEVQDRRTATRANFSAGRSTSWSLRTPYTPRTTAPSPSTTTPSRSSSATMPPSTKGAPAGPAPSSSSSIGKTSQVQCRKCTGLGHFARDCPTLRVMVALADGGYDSASDYNDDTLALIAHDEQQAAATPETSSQYMSAEAAEAYPTMVAQRVLSVQIT